MKTVTIRTPYDTPDLTGQIGAKFASIKKAVEFLLHKDQFYFDPASNAGMVAAIRAALPAARAEWQAVNAVAVKKGMADALAHEAAADALAQKIAGKSSVSQGEKNALSAEYAALKNQRNGWSIAAVEAALAALVVVITKEEITTIVLAALAGGARLTSSQLSEMTGIDPIKLAMRTAGMLRAGELKQDKVGRYFV